MPDAIIYLGPSLPLEEARRILPEHLGAEYRLPVRRGDLAGAVAIRPRIIGIIDGLFFESASVGHREILGALRAGIRVIGSSSMGALRAAELSSFGMEGVGEIFRRYQTGSIESDDEVALICDPYDGQALSEPLINIRITFESALQTGTITRDEMEVLMGAAISRYYPDRTFAQVIGASGLADLRLAEIRAWVSEHRVDQKRHDAIEALEYIRDILMSGQKTTPESES